MKIGYGFWLQWVLVTFGGFLVSLLFFEVGEKPDVGAAEGAIGGAVIGLAQWFVLRQRVSQVGWWVLASIAAWALLGGSSLGALGWVAPKNISYLPFRLVYGIVNGVQVGALLGVAQWFVLRKQVSRAHWWIVASSVGWVIGLALSWTLGGGLRFATGLFLGEVVGLALGWLVVAAITGVALVELLRSTAHPKTI